jgi:outer membrane protein, adhesin transport system
MHIVKFSCWWLLCLIGSAAVPAQAGSMIDLLNLTFQGNPALRSQSQLVQASQAEIRGANWQFFPTPSMSVEQVNASQNDSSYNSKDGRVLTLRLQQPLWTAGRLTAGVGRAEAGMAAAQAQMEETRQQLALRTIQAWGEWKAGQQKLDALRGSVQTHQKLVALIQRRIDGGVSALADEVLAQGRLEQTLADAMAAQSQLTAALAKLESLTGQRVADEQVSAYSVSAVEPVGQLAPLLDNAWVNSPTAMKLRAQVRQQELDVEIRKAQLLPEVYARAEHQQGSFTSFGPSSANRFFIGLSATPGAGLSALSGVDAAVARLQSLQSELDATRRSLIEQVSLEHVSALTQAQRRLSLRSGLSSTQAMVDSWDRQFLAGRKTWVEVMNAARELAQAQTALAEVEVGYVVATWRLAVLAEGVPAIISGLGAPIQAMPASNPTRP